MLLSKVKYFELYRLIINPEKLNGTTIFKNSKFSTISTGIFKIQNNFNRDIQRAQRRRVARRGGDDADVVGGNPRPHVAHLPRLLPGAVHGVREGTGCEK